MSREQHPLDTLLSAIRDGLNNDAKRDPPEAAMTVEFSRREWKVFRDALAMLAAVRPTPTKKET